MRLDEHDLVYCFFDAVYLKLRPDDTPAEGVLVAWGVTLAGRRLQLDSRESYEDWLDFGRDLLARGLKPPALRVADGAPGPGRQHASSGRRRSSSVQLLGWRSGRVFLSERSAGGREPWQRDRFRSGVQTCSSRRWAARYWR